METRVWRAHALAPVIGADEVWRILRASTRYYNALVEIERDRSERFAATRRAFAPELAALEDAWSALGERAGDIVRGIKHARQEHWRATKGDASLLMPEQMEAELDAVREEQRRLGVEAKPLRKAFAARLEPDTARFKAETTARAAGAGPRVKERINVAVLEEMLADPTVDEAWKRVRESDAIALAESKAARASCGLPPGTYLQVEESIQRAKKDSEGRPLRFKSFRGEGKVAVQLHKTTVDDVLSGASTFLRLTPDPKPGKKGRSDEHYICRIRIGSEGRAPVWAAFPVRLHRMPPRDASVAWAWITVRKQGERVAYELQLVVQHATFGVPTRPAGVGDGGHIRLGWSRVPDGVCVAAWEGGDVVVPRRILERADLASRLTGHADTHYDVLRRVLRSWQGPGIRWDWLRSERARLWLRGVLVQWAEHVIGAAALRALWRAWRQSDPPDLFPSLPSASRWVSGRGHRDQHARLAWWCFLWTRKDAHLRQWSADARRGVENQRDALFREAAIRIATQYETIAIDSYSVADMKKRPAPLTLPGESPNEVAQHNVQVAAPGRFREILREVMGPRCTPRERPGDAGSAGVARKGKSARDPTRWRVEEQPRTRSAATPRPSRRGALAMRVASYRDR